ncbi:uncharacterized protein V2V93DRAFT_374847 [Kockiozyma suomiensis]|uniref:uncharacterized protein n=1 Tax=Kockiozyma suomiensis TaxID=1337062 RepID=UPI00334302F9
MRYPRLITALAARRSSSSCLISRISSLSKTHSSPSVRYLSTSSHSPKPSTSSSTASVIPPHPVAVNASNAAEDDRLLRAIFDSPTVWGSFFSSLGDTSSVGLLNNSRLTSAHSLTEFAEATLRSAQRVAAAITAIDTSSLTGDDCRRVVRLFDRLSEMLCRVIDLAEFVRTVHPDEAYLAGAESAHNLMMGYMIELNSSDELFGVLRKVLETAGIENELSREEMIVGKLLLDDFEKSGAALDLSIREEVVAAQHNIAALSREFMTNLHPAAESISVDINELTGLDPTLVNGLRVASALENQPRNFGFASRLRNGKPSPQALAKVRTVKLPTVGAVSRMAAVSVHSSKIREQLYINHRKSSARQIDILEALLMQRMRLANLMGSSSFAEYQLTDKMARTPEAVRKFLDNLAAKTRPAAEAEIAILRKFKVNDKRNQEDPLLRIWDRDYYLSQYIEQTRQPRVRSSDHLNAYFSVGTVMQGLSRLFTKLYGIRFVPRETNAATSETWHPDVRKLDIMADTGSPLHNGGGEQRVGIMYCDLFAREGKPRAPAHYTVRCSRQIYEEENYDGFDDGIYDIPTMTDRDGSVFQLPTVGLVCDFSSRADGRASLLSFAEVETLFHEMGHAMHSMLGRTALHNISGTRCATDFVELPSVLMEYFATNADVLGLFARHHETDEPLPMPLLEAHLRERAGFKCNDTYTQIEMSLLDQALHSVSPSSLGSAGQLDSTAICRALEKRYSLFPVVDGTSWQGQFGHLVGYGAVYYSYLLDRAMASQVWLEVFSGGANGGAVSRDAGEKFKNEVLAWGAGRDAWQCIAGVLGREELRSGGERAMELVAMGADEDAGSWR